MPEKNMLTRRMRLLSKLSQEAKRKQPHVALAPDFENPDLGEHRSGQELQSKATIRRFLHAETKDYQNKTKISRKFSPQSTRESLSFLSTKGQADSLHAKETTTPL